MAICQVTAKSAAKATRNKSVRRRRKTLQSLTASISCQPTRVDSLGLTPSRILPPGLEGGGIRTKAFELGRWTGVRRRWKTSQTTGDIGWLGFLFTTAQSRARQVVVDDSHFRQKEKHIQTGCYGNVTLVSSHKIVAEKSTSGGVG